MTAHDIILWLEQHVARQADLCLDTRQLQAGDVFFACPGRTTNGRAFIEQAIANGAGAIVVQSDEADPVLTTSVPLLRVPGLRDVLGAVGDQWYGRPSTALTVVAVTGTNGKTSCVQWLAAALNADGVACGSIGTLGVLLPDGSSLGGVLTTPDVLTMHRSLAQLREAQVHVVAMEASSIGLEQGRLNDVAIDIAAFTNLTRDHLDYHQTEAKYRQAKFLLFKMPGLRRALVNADDEAGRSLLASLSPDLAWSYSVSEPTATLYARDLHPSGSGQVFTLVGPEGSAQILTPLVGEHNVSNLLLVAGALKELGWSIGRIARTLPVLRSVPGRLELVLAVPDSVVSNAPAAQASVVEPDFRRASAGPLVLVDYAHTPDALERALKALRPMADMRAGRLVCVFGCGGNRDAGKRPMMGRIAEGSADVVIVTDDNPRTENPTEIIAQIAAGMSAPPRVIGDRAVAIMTAVWDARPEDVILVAGKGHETYQEVHGVRTPFDDREWARAALTWLSAQQSGVSTDSRAITPGQLFVALKGETFDGHAYLAAIADAGARAAIVEVSNPAIALPQIVLGDTRQALIRMATAWRAQFTLPVIAVTGSNGKTTTKEMLASILREALGDAASLATHGNLNNDIGVPLTVLRLRSGHEAAVLELGMNHPGEIAVLAAIAKPTVALVNNAQREHQEFMHSVEAVAQENGAVLESLGGDGVAVFPGGDPYTGLWQALAGGRQTLRFGLDAACDVYAADVVEAPESTRFRLHTPAGSALLTLAAPGEHNLRNALAAAASAISAGFSLDAVVKGLQAFSPVAGRMQLRSLPGNIRLIDDTYNANPDSVRAAIDVLARLAGTKALVLGDMAEVGDNGPAMHAEVGQYARQQGIDELLVYGDACAHAVEAFGPAARRYGSVEELAQDLVLQLPANILVKGSRSMRMERVITALEEKLSLNQGRAHHAS
ncbi:bifunctional UDP-N-acetylmuramoyl-L-alanyl-D-glutamate--2,6-diaminopimelate ligase MurE/UDP-N-acetylmuramoyl-tripeptide--D-alanyl-D-alanine ligase MurF [Allopusillimonas ginsengisoli]|uniref:bifunctional UDP-N-acetylmuramoyl-L-alanyl-D-glutamate--2, 6-diaminopimelate ligase MurE/UDP-N-acetylmuramoyl-tripeptide--D-alanyl-D-alanine ligase MurF n=1 Tax=Allopusillimonas ginsengisoli TaxID=453575 RepID=UPI0010C1884D|nr:bifunctional UDP-N-acetylmuramoyl-L-alanyl-D-glutamate--2,6-diaminopimelate ligase MurE/UDP-N-acetylmuramoyl-tripeptide--D-alanyl-D-alanine ligase MurF [Allopusillimonas ginsengisoli]